MNWDKFKDKFEEGWGLKLRPFIESEECDKIYQFLKERGRFGHKILPNSLVTYRAFQECPYDKLKCVMIGQDPYPQFYNGVETADGLSFSCGNTGKCQPSLNALYDGMEDDLAAGMDLQMYKEPNLKYLANQGVLLLNSALTVEKDKIGSHSDVNGVNIWEPFFKFLIEEVLNSYTIGTPYILLGKQAQNLEKYILPFNYPIFKAEHPSVAARKERKWEHNKVFSSVNTVLKDRSGEWINWYEIIPF